MRLFWGNFLQKLPSVRSGSCGCEGVRCGFAHGKRSSASITVKLKLWTLSDSPDPANLILQYITPAILAADGIHVTCAKPLVFDYGHGSDFLMVGACSPATHPTAHRRIPGRDWTDGVMLDWLPSGVHEHGGEYNTSSPTAQKVD